MTEKDPAGRTARHAHQAPKKSPFKVLLITALLIVALLLGVGVAAVIDNAHNDKAATSSSSVTSSVSSQTSSVTASSTSVSSASSATSSSVATSESSSSELTGTPGVVATDLTQNDRASILAQVITTEAGYTPADVHSITTGVVDGVGSGKGRVVVGIGVNGIGATYTLSGDGGVGVMTGSYTGGNGDSDHPFTIDVNDWLRTHNLQDVQAEYGLVMTSN